MDPRSSARTTAPRMRPPPREGWIHLHEAAKARVIRAPQYPRRHVYEDSPTALGDVRPQDAEAPAH